MTKKEINLLKNILENIEIAQYWEKQLHNCTGEEYKIMTRYINMAQTKLEKIILEETVKKIKIPSHERIPII